MTRIGSRRPARPSCPRSTGGGQGRRADFRYNSDILLLPVREEPVMQLPVMMERLPDGRGFTAHLAAPLQLSAQAGTAEEAERQLAALLQQRLQEGIELRALTVPLTKARGSEPGWLPDDELTREWLQEIDA